MKYKALIGFSGVVTMAQGEIKEIDNPDVAKDLLRAKFIEEVKEDKGAKAPAEEKKAEKKK